MDNQNPQKIESKCEEKFRALKMEIDILKKVNMLEEKSEHTQNWLCLRIL